MTTFTRIMLNQYRREARKFLTNPHAMHAAVAKAFPPDTDVTHGRILWRLDKNGHEDTLYIVGPEQPTADHIVDQAGWETRPPQVASYDAFLARLMKGQQWGFELVANPTFSEPQPGGKRGKVRAHVSATHQLDWLIKRSESCGFSLLQDNEPTARVVERKVLSFQRDPNSNRKNNVRIHTARFKGSLTVIDPELLRNTLKNGIGRGRGYGCGLLTLAPARQDEY